jgi:oxygen-independent coproporphyrinogen-3 oxidase
MAGFYIHIPFCRKVCYYCDFHFTASLKNKNKVLEAIKTEIIRRSNDWKNTTFDTFYFGGGTPSILSIDEIVSVTDLVFKMYKFSDNPEFTIEANPDDLSKEYLSGLKQRTKVNRLSIGIQTFNNDLLKYLNRRHSGMQAIESVKDAQLTGIENITIDLIYGIPGMENSMLQNDLDTFIGLEIPHLSAYHLSIEPKTVFGVMQKRNQIKPVNEEISMQQYGLVTQTLKKNGYEHYEISNFAKNSMYSKHNTSYWNDQYYIGIGPSAHSYNGLQRRWNISDNSQYTNALLSDDNTYFDEEVLTKQEKYNDYILTSLRTKWGADLTIIEKNFGIAYADHFQNIYTKKEMSKNFITDGYVFRLSETGWFIADYIMSEFFWV